MNVLTTLIGAGALLVFAPAQAEESTASTSKDSSSAKTTEPRDCIRDTGTRIRHREGECSGVPGRVVTREDIDHSGAANVGDALRTLDPRVGLKR